jgi:hypothetical protein
MQRYGTIAKRMIGRRSMMTYADYLATGLSVVAVCAVLYFLLVVL